MMSMLKPGFPWITKWEGVHNDIIPTHTAIIFFSPEMKEGDK